MDILSISRTIFAPFDSGATSDIGATLAAYPDPFSSTTTTAPDPFASTVTTAPDPFASTAKPKWN
jgi:hypothetical protein